MAELKWSVRLDDKMSATAKAAAKSVDKLGDSLQGLKKAAGGVTSAGAKLSAFQRLVQFTGQNFGTRGVNALMAASRGAVWAGEKLGPVWKAVGPALMTAGAAAAAAAAAIIGLGLAATGAALQGAMAFSETKAKSIFAFEKLLGGGAAAAKAWDLVTASARKTKMPISEVASGINSLVAAGFDLKTADTIFKQLADLKTLNPMANTEGIVRAIGQIKAIGRLQGDELMQLSEAGVNVADVYEEIAKRMKVTKEEVVALQREGKIDAKTAIESIQAAIAKKTGKDSGAVAGKAPKTAAETLQRLKEQFFDLVNLDFGPVQSFLGKLESAIDGKGGKALAGSLERLFKAIGQGLDSMSVDDINAMMTGFARSIDGVTSAVKAMTSAYREVTGFLDDFNARGPVLQGTVEGLGNTFLTAVTGGLYPFLAVLGDMIDWIGSVGDMFSEVSSEISEAAAGLGGDIISGIVQGIVDAAGEVAAAVRNACQSAIDAGKDVLDIGSPSKEFARIGRWSMEGFARGVNDNSPLVAYAVADRMGNAAQVGAQAAQNVVNNSTTSSSKTVSIGAINGQSDPKGTRSALESLFRSLNFAAA